MLLVSKKQNMKLPILLITFKRLDTTAEVLKAIEAYQPNELYIFSDDGREIKEKQKVKKVRSFIHDSITWDCEINTFYSETNLGCKYGPQSAITWFFKNVDKGIILEDDTVPNQSFYTYCEELLNRYKNDLRVWNIGGTKMDEYYSTVYSYRFSKFPHTWGWATWADRWNLHIATIDDLKQDISLKELNDIFPNKSIIKNWRQKANISLNDELDAWDYLWSIRVLSQGGLSTSPQKNLISNIGFGEDATHTFREGTQNIITNETLNFPLVHPSIILPDIKKDVAFFERYFNWKPLSKKINLKHIIRVINARLFNR